MTLILLFNTVNSLTIKEMAGQTGLTISDILRSVKVTYYHGQWKRCSHHCCLLISWFDTACFGICFPRRWLILEYSTRLKRRLAKRRNCLLILNFQGWYLELYITLSSKPLDFANNTLSSANVQKSKSVHWSKQTLRKRTMQRARLSKKTAESFYKLR
jgi:hypothetical protein